MSAKYLELIHPPKLETIYTDPNKMKIETIVELKRQMVQILSTLFVENEICALVHWLKFFQLQVPFLKWDESVDDSAIMFMIARFRKHMNLKELCLLRISELMYKENKNKKNNYYSWRIHMMFRYEKCDNQVCSFQERYIDAFIMMKDKDRQKKFFLTLFGTLSEEYTKKVMNGDRSNGLIDLLQKRPTDNEHGVASKYRLVSSVSICRLNNRDEPMVPETTMSTLWLQYVQLPIENDGTQTTARTNLGTHQRYELILFL